MYLWIFYYYNFLSACWPMIDKYNVFWLSLHLVNFPNFDCINPLQNKCSLYISHLSGLLFCQFLEFNPFLYPTFVLLLVKHHAHVSLQINCVFYEWDKKNDKYRFKRHFHVTLPLAKISYVFSDVVLFSIYFRSFYILHKATAE